MKNRDIKLNIVVTGILKTDLAKAAKAANLIEEFRTINTFRREVYGDFDENFPKLTADNTFHDGINLLNKLRKKLWDDLEALGDGKNND